MAIILRLDRMMADRKISLNDLAEKVGIANINLTGEESMTDSELLIVAREMKFLNMYVS